MASSPKRAARRKRFEDLITDPATMITIVQRVAEGGSLVELAREWEVPFGQLSSWIAAETDRQERYAVALTLRNEFLSELVLMGIRAIADVDPADAYTKQGKLLSVHKMPLSVRRALQGIDTDTIGVKKLKFVPRERALELLGRYRKMFTDKVEHEHKVTLEDLVSGSMPPPAAAVKSGDK